MTLLGCAVLLAVIICCLDMFITYKAYKKMQAAEKQHLKMAEILRGKQAEFDRARIASEWREKTRTAEATPSQWRQG